MKESCYVDRKFVSNCGVYGYMQVFYHFSDLLKRTVVQTISDICFYGNLDCFVEEGKSLIAFQ